jgi:hypothetical protein
MYKVIFHHYHKQNYCNVIRNSTGKNMIENVLLSNNYNVLLSNNVNCPVPVNLLSSQTISTITVTDKRV